MIRDSVDSIEMSFLRSALTLNSDFFGVSELKEWLHAREHENRFSVEEIRFQDMKQWGFEKNTGNLVHESGGFYKIKGVRVHTNFGKVFEWEQPMIDQPEIGILGILTKKINGMSYFLMQAKMEPGNINISQFSPTIQATKSNYTQVHKGKRPLFLDYFLGHEKATVIVDCLQSEQGGAFLGKLNRNMIVEVTGDIDVPSDFCWLTLGQLKHLATIDDLVNMDARSVVSCVRYIDIDHAECPDKLVDACIDEGHGLNDFGKKLLKSLAIQSYAEKSIEEILHWITSNRVRYFHEVEVFGLTKLSTWVKEQYEIKDESNQGFSINAVKVKAGNREVSEWDQPLIKNTKIGLVGFISQVRKGILHFLVQAKMEPGYRDVVELAPTVSLSSAGIHDVNVSYLDYFSDSNSSANQKRLSVIMSEEGGRFFHLRNLYRIIEIDENETIDIDENYVWMSLGQMMELSKYSGYLNVEARSLISILKFN